MSARLGLARLADMRLAGEDSPGVIVDADASNPVTITQTPVTQIIRDDQELILTTRIQTSARLARARLGLMRLASNDDYKIVQGVLYQSILVTQTGGIGETRLTTSDVAVTSTAVGRVSPNRQERISQVTVATTATLNVTRYKPLTQPIGVQQTVTFRNTVVRVSVTTLIDVASIGIGLSSDRRVFVTQNIDVLPSNLPFGDRRPHVQQRIDVAGVAIGRTEFVNVSVGTSLTVQQPATTNIRTISVRQEIYATQTALGFNTFRRLAVNQNIEVEQILTFRNTSPRQNVVQPILIITSERHGRNTIEVFQYPSNSLIVDHRVSTNYKVVPVRQDIFVSESNRAQGVRTNIGIIESLHSIDMTGLAFVSPLNALVLDSLRIETEARTNYVHMIMASFVGVNTRAHAGQKISVSTSNFIPVTQTTTFIRNFVFVSAENSIGVNTTTRLPINRIRVSTPITVTTDADPDRILYRSAETSLTVSQTEQHVRYAYLTGSDQITLTDDYQDTIQNRESAESLIQVQSIATKKNIRVLNLRDNVYLQDHLIGLKIVQNVILTGIGQVVLPAAQLGDTDGSQSQIDLKRSMDNTTYTVIAKHNRRRLQYRFNISKAPMSQLFQFLKDNRGRTIQLQNWKGEVFEGKVLSDYSETSAGRDATRYEAIPFDLVFEGEKLT